MTHRGELYEFFSRWKVFSFTSLLVLMLASGMRLDAQTDPGPRGGAPGAGTPIAGLTAGENDFFFRVATTTVQ